MDWENDDFQMMAEYREDILTDITTVRQAIIECLPMLETSRIRLMMGRVMAETRRIRREYE